MYKTLAACCACRFLRLFSLKKAVKTTINGLSGGSGFLAPFLKAMESKKKF
jgi:hypothetical protein